MHFPKANFLNYIFFNFFFKIVSLITCFGGIYYGFFLGEFYQILTYPEDWTFTQDLSNVNYCLFNSLYPAGSFIGTLIAGYCTFKYG